MISFGRIFLLGVIFWPLIGFPISHIGGGKMSSSESGFVAQLPQDIFFSVREYGNEALYAQTINMGGSIGSNYGGAYFYDLKKALSELSLLPNVSDLDLWMKERLWTKVEIPIKCQMIYSKESGGNRTWVVAWGPGVGIYFVTPVGTYFEQAVRQFIYSIQLNEGACQWRITGR